MSASPTFLHALLAMAAASYACRAAGFVLMHYIPVTPRVEAALKAIPLGVMVGIVMPSLAAQRIPELAGLAVVLLVMKTLRHDVVAAIAGAAAVGICRSLGF